VIISPAPQSRGVRQITMNIGQAVEHLKAGGAVARPGWNGKGMFLILVPGSVGLKVEAGRPLAAHLPVGTTFDYLPHVDMKTAQGPLVPWLCSQTDLLADDWEVVEKDQPVGYAEGGTDPRHA
jgi:hypothetical protein